MKTTIPSFGKVQGRSGKRRRLGPAPLGAFALSFLLLSLSAAGAAPPLLPPDPLALPQVNLFGERPSLGLQPLGSVGLGNAGAGGPSASRLIFILQAPLLYNSNPGYATSASSPTYGSDPQFELIHSARAGRGLLFTQIVAADSTLYPDYPGYNLNTFSGQLQLDFTDQGLGFDAAPFLAFKTGFTVPAHSGGYAWINDLEAGFNLNRILGSGGRRGEKDPLEVDFNLGASQRWLRIDNGSGDASVSGSTALEIEMPFIYNLTSRLQFILDFTAYTRCFDVNQSAENRDRLDEVLNFPFSLGWTMVPDIGLKIVAIQSFTQGFSSVAGQDVFQLTTGVSLLAIFQ